jgi:hypothetical protein
MFRPGELVIYAVTKSSTHPGPRAKAIFPTPKGDDYHYEVDKFWIVSAIRSDGKLVLRTRRGKERIIDPQDPLLRRARWWERLVYRSRFPQLANG